MAVASLPATLWIGADPPGCPDCANWRISLVSSICEVEIAYLGQIIHLPGYDNPAVIHCIVLLYFSVRYETSRRGLKSRRRGIINELIVSYPRQSPGCTERNRELNYQVDPPAGYKVDLLLLLSGVLVSFLQGMYHPVYAQYTAWNPAREQKARPASWPGRIQRPGALCFRRIAT